MGENTRITCFDFPMPHKLDLSGSRIPRANCTRFDLGVLFSWYVRSDAARALYHTLLAFPVLAFKIFRFFICPLQSPLEAFYRFLYVAKCSSG